MKIKAWSEGFRKRRICWPAWCILGIVLLASLPLFMNYCTGGRELAFHLRRIENMKDMLRSGSFAVREGTGFLMDPAVFRMFGMSVQNAYKCFLFLSNVLTAWIGYICFGRMFRDKAVGVLGSMLYAWAPYRFDLLYCRAAFGEIAAYSFFPLVLCGIYRIYTEETDTKQFQYVWVLPAVGFTGIVQSNILSFLMAAGFTLSVCMICMKRTFNKYRFLALCKMVLSFAVVNMIYLLPVLKSLANEEGNLWRDVGFIQKKGIYALNYLRIFFRYGQADIYEKNSMVGSEPVGVGFAVTICIIVYLWLLLVDRKRKEGNDELWKMGKIFAVLGGAFIWFSLNHFPWDYLRTVGNLFLRFITLLQSPVKFVVLVVLITVFLSCLTVRRIRAGYPTVWKYYLTAVIAAAVLTTQFLVGSIISSNGRLDIVTAADIPETVSDSSEYLP